MTVPSASQSVAPHPAPVLLLLGGHSGTGKTALSRHALPALMRATGAPWMLLDKDTACGLLSFELMQELSGDGNDRDSPLFKQRVRPVEYETVLRLACEQLALGVSVLSCTPYGAEFANPPALQQMIARLPAPTRVVQVWAHVDPATAWRRINRRANPLDRYKLAHWDEHLASRHMPSSIDFPDLLLLDTSEDGEPAAAAQAQSVVQWVCRQPAP